MQSDHRLPLRKYDVRHLRYVALTRDLKNSGLIKEHREGLFTKHRDSFKGQDLLDWLVKEKGLGSPPTHHPQMADQ